VRIVRRPIALRLLDWSSRRLGYGDDDPATNGELRLLDDLPPTPVVFDVGARHGDYAVAVLSRRSAASVCCFEPSQSSFAVLRSRLDGRATLRNCALAEHAGIATLWADADGSGMSSLYRRDLDQLGIEFNRVSEQVTVSTVDIECELAGIEHIDLLKIDAEGAEAAVIGGAAGLIATDGVDRIAFEYGGTALDSGRFVRDFYGQLADRYDLYRVLPDGLLPMGRYRENYERAEYVNMVAVRRS
jgi:FkbM family methyltransferase